MKLKIIMEKEMAEKLSEFNIAPTEEIMLSQRYKPYENYLRQTLSGEGMMGENSRYIEVSFIGMDNEEIKVIGNNFDDFINYVWSKS